MNIWMIRKSLMKQLYLKKKNLKQLIDDKQHKLEIEDITDVDCMHGKTVLKDFEIKNLGKYHDLYL